METKKVEVKKKTRKEINEKMSKTGKVRNRPLKYLAKEDFLQIRVNLLEIEKVDLEVKEIITKIDNNNKANFILQQQISNKKAIKNKLNGEHQKFVDDLMKKTGIDIRNKSIDYITREVKDINDG